MENAEFAERPAHVPEERVVDFDFYNPPGVEQGFHDAWRSLHAPGVPDLVWTPRNGGHWIATRSAKIGEVFSDYERFSSRIIIVPKAVGEQYRMLPTIMDPPEHRPFRSLLNNGLSPKTVRGMTDVIREVAATLVDEVAAAGHCNFTTAFAEQFPIRIFMGIVELPLEDAPKIKYLTDQVVHPDGTMTYAETEQQFYDYVEPHIDARLNSGRDDMLTQIVNGMIGDRPLEKREMQSLCMQVLMGGVDTVVNFLGFVFLFLAQHPTHRRELVENPALIPDAVNELLRRFPVVSMAREVRSDIEYDGVTLKSGDMIVAPSPLSGTDDRENPQPLTVDFRRRSAVHATFGKGNHTCPGAHLARAELRIALEEWLKRIPDFDVAPHAQVAFRGGIVGTVTQLPLVWRAT